MDVLVLACIVALVGTTYGLYRVVAALGARS